MDKILFYDDRHEDMSFYTNGFIFDYFDIEIKKILKHLGYSSKDNPKIFFDWDDEKPRFNFSCNINKDTVDKLIKIPKVGIVFDCYK